MADPVWMLDLRASSAHGKSAPSPTLLSGSHILRRAYRTKPQTGAVMDCWARYDAFFFLRLPRVAKQIEHVTALARTRDGLENSRKCTNYLN